VHHHTSSVYPNTVEDDARCSAKTVPLLRALQHTSVIPSVCDVSSADINHAEDIQSLTAALQGLGKRVNVDQFRLQKRGGVGLKGISLGDGDALAAIQTVRIPSLIPQCNAGHKLQQIRNSTTALAAQTELFFIKYWMGHLKKIAYPDTRFA